MKCCWRDIYGVLLLAVLLLAACQEKTEHGTRIPLVEAAGKFLYQDDLMGIIPDNLSSADSVAFVKDYMHKWAEDQVFYERARRNIPNDGRIDRMVEEYKRMLILNDYEQRLLQQQLNNTLEEAELQAYYSDNKELFMLEEPVIKGLFLKIPLNAPGLNDLKKWYKMNSIEALERVEQYAFRNAVVYEYFYDQWMPVSEMEGKIIINLSELSGDFEKHRNIEAEDGEYCYLLHIEDYILKGEVKPYVMARYDIVDLLSNMRRVDFMKQVKEGLYNQSMEMGRIKYYDDETKQIMGDTLRNAADGTRSVAR